MLSLTFFFLPYSAHFFTAHRIPLSISCSHQHFQSLYHLSQCFGTRFSLFCHNLNYVTAFKLQSIYVSPKLPPGSANTYCSSNWSRISPRAPFLAEGLLGSWNFGSSAAGWMGTWCHSHTVTILSISWGTGSVNLLQATARFSLQLKQREWGWSDAGTGCLARWLVPRARQSSGGIWTAPSGTCLSFWLALKGSGGRTRCLQRSFWLNDCI